LMESPVNALKVFVKSALARFGYRLVRLHAGSWSESILNDHYGWALSREGQKAIDASAQPWPWFTYPAIEYLNQMSFADRDVFEWGGGNSSLFFAGRCNSITTVESDRNWVAYLEGNKRSNHRIILREPARFASAIVEQEARFDVIVIDAWQRNQCARLAPQFLRKGGLIVLDNSDWFPEASRVLRESGLIQVDMHGFGPINQYTWTTSLFFDRGFNFTSVEPRQPNYSLAASRMSPDEVAEISGEAPVSPREPPN